MVAICVACADKPVETPKEEIEELQQEEPKQEGQTIDTQNVTVDKAFKLLQMLYEDKNMDFSFIFEKISSDDKPDENGLIMDSYKITDKINCFVFYKEHNLENPESILISGQQIETLDELDASVNLGASFVSVISEQDLEKYISTIGNCIDNKSTDAINTDNLYIEVDCTKSPAIFISTNKNFIRSNNK